jgi:DNA (cytosine-5)-methyltransferase 1
MPFLTNYFGTGGADPVTDPLSTITTKARHGLALPLFADNSDKPKLPYYLANPTPAMKSLLKTMGELGVVDIRFRMLSTKELLRAQGFRDDYKLHGTKEEITKQIGNSVCVKVAKAICEALAA